MLPTRMVQCSTRTHGLLPILNQFSLFLARAANLERQQTVPFFDILITLAARFVRDGISPPGPSPGGAMPTSANFHRPYQPGGSEAHFKFQHTVIAARP